MESLIKQKFKNFDNSIITTFLIIIFFGIIIINGCGGMHNGAEYDIGYADIMDHVAPLARLSNGEIPFRDFYYSYGPLTLIILYIPFISLGQNFFSYLVSFYILSPLVVFLIYFFVFKKVFKNQLMSLAALYFVYAQQMLVTGPTALRMTFPLLVVPLLLITSYTKLRYFLLGLLVVISFFISYEYGITTLFACIGIIIILSIDSVLHKKPFTGPVFLFFGIVLGISIAFTILLKFGMLQQFFSYAFFTSSYFTNFPAQPILLPPAIFLRQQDVFGILASLSTQNFRFYFVGGFYAVSLLYLFYKLYKSKFTVQKDDIIIAFLTTYGLLSFFRPLSTPTYEYLFYSVPALLVLVGIYCKKISLYFYQRERYGIILFSFFFFLFSFVTPRDWFFGLEKIPATLANSFGITKTEKKEVFDSQLGLVVDATLSKEYQKITKYLTSHTKHNDYIFVYPYGPYNLLAHRRNPTFSDEELYRRFYPEGFEAYDKRMIKELEAKKTQVIVLNTYNSGGVVTKSIASVGNQSYITWPNEKHLFITLPTDVKPILIKYIIENYEPVEYFEYAVVLKKKKVPQKLNYSFIPIQSIANSTNKIIIHGLKAGDKSSTYRIIGRYPYLTACWNKPLTAEAVTFTIESKFMPFMNYFAKPIISVLLGKDCNDPTTLFYSGSFILKRNVQTTYHFSKIEKIEGIKSMSLAVIPNEPFNILPYEITVREFKIGAITFK